MVTTRTRAVRDRSMPEMDILHTRSYVGVLSPALAPYWKPSSQHFGTLRELLKEVVTKCPFIDSVVLVVAEIRTMARIGDGIYSPFGGKRCHGIFHPDC